MKLNIRQEQKKDYQSVFKLIERAFKDEKFSNHKEHFLVERLRQSQSFIPELSLLCEVEDKIVGYILLTKVKVKNTNDEFTSLALAPVAVLPEHQGKGIGGALIKASHQNAKALGYESIIVLGHEKYYPRFGYKLLDDFGISLPFEAPKENCMAIELYNDSLKKINGEVIYPKEFME